MPNPRSIERYDDIKAVFDAALAAGLPAEYALQTPSAAIRWRARANSFRRLTSVPAYRGVTLSIPKEPGNVVILRHEEIGELRRPSGEPIPVEPPEPELSPEERAALDLARELGLKP